MIGAITHEIHKVISLNGLLSGSSGRNSPADEMDVAREKQLQNGNETSPMAAAENKNDVQAHPNNQDPFTNYITMEVIQFCLLYFQPIYSKKALYRLPDIFIDFLNRCYDQ